MAVESKDRKDEQVEASSVSEGEDGVEDSSSGTCFLFPLPRVPCQGLLFSLERCVVGDGGHFFSSSLFVCIRFFHFFFFLGCVLCFK